MKYQTESLNNKSALITGASSGIGLACAHYLGQHGVKLKLVARREAKLKELCALYSCEYVCGDLNDASTLKEIKNKGFFSSDIVINNAGLALGKDDFAQITDEDMDQVIHTNIQAAFKIAKYSIKEMTDRSSGDLINICSIASHEAYKGGAVYCASKHALLALGKSLREETFGQNIRIISISPGLVETEFSKVRFKRDEEKASKVYTGMVPLLPEDIAWQIVHALQTPRHVNIDEIIVLATDQAGATKVKRDTI